MFPPRVTIPTLNGRWGSVSSAAIGVIASAFGPEAIPIGTVIGAVVGLISHNKETNNQRLGL